MVGGGAALPTSAGETSADAMMSSSIALVVRSVVVVVRDVEGHVGGVVVAVGVNSNSRLSQRRIRTFSGVRVGAKVWRIAARRDLNSFLNSTMSLRAGPKVWPESLDGGDVDVAVVDGGVAGIVGTVVAAGASGATTATAATGVVGAGTVGTAVAAGASGATTVAAATVAAPVTNTLTYPNMN